MHQVRAPCWPVGSCMCAVRVPLPTILLVPPHHTQQRVDRIIELFPAVSRDQAAHACATVPRHVHVLVRSALSMHEQVLQPGASA